MSGAWIGVGATALGALLCALAPSLAVLRVVFTPASVHLAGVVPWTVAVGAPVAVGLILVVATRVRRRRSAT